MRWWLVLVRITMRDAGVDGIGHGDGGDMQRRDAPSGDNLLGPTMTAETGGQHQYFSPLVTFGALPTWRAQLDGTAGVGQTDQPENGKSRVDGGAPPACGPYDFCHVYLLKKASNNVYILLGICTYRKDATGITWEQVMGVTAVAADFA
jgi:hypothetical protein